MLRVDIFVCLSPWSFQQHTTLSCPIYILYFNTVHTVHHILHYPSVYQLLGVIEPAHLMHTRCSHTKILLWPHQVRDLLLLLLLLNRRYSSLWALVCSTIIFQESLSNTFFFQFLILIICRSFRMSSSHLILGLPIGLEASGFHL